MSGRLCSMTGIGEAAGELSPRFFARVKVWSVNSRGLEVSVRFSPRWELPELDLSLRRLVGETLARGRVTVSVSLERRSAQGALVLHWEVCQALLEALAAKPPELSLAPLTFGDLATLPGFVEVPEQALEPEEVQVLLELARRGLAQLQESRAREAALLVPALKAELENVDGFVRFLRKEGEALRPLLVARLRARLGELLGGAVDETRLLQEAALLAERADVAEEANRLAAHLQHFCALLAEGGPVGRKLDFLVQEMLREVNTAGSKLRDVGAGERVVEAKAALERLREQIANLE
ncbi:MAG: YicC family protein [Thermoanaerobaculum sp.]